MAEGTEDSPLTTNQVSLPRRRCCISFQWLPSFNSPLPGDGTSSLFSVAFNSLYNYNSESNGSSLNGSCHNGSSSLVNSAVARSTSSHNLDPDQENKKRKDLEYKWVRVILPSGFVKTVHMFLLHTFVFCMKKGFQLSILIKLKAIHDKFLWELNKCHLEFLPLSCSLNLFPPFLADDAAIRWNRRPKSPSDLQCDPWDGWRLPRKISRPSARQKL